MAANQTVLQAWVEICHQIFDGWEVQTMWKLQKNMNEEACFKVGIN